MIPKNYLSILAFLLVLVSGCTPGAPLQSTLHTEALHHKWKITALKDAPQPLPYAFLDLRDVYHASAAIGCDTLQVTLRLGHNNRIALDDHIAGRGVTPGYTNATAQWLFIKQLAGVYSYKITANHLELLDRDGAALLSGSIDVDDEQGSVARKWTIIKMIHVSSDSFALLNPFIDLTDLSQSHAFVGCNQLQFRAKLAAPYTLTLDNITSTRKYCKAAMDYEYIITKAMPLVTKYQVIGDRLKLFDKDNVLLLEGLDEKEKMPPVSGVPAKGLLNRQWMLTGMEGFTREQLIAAKAYIDLTDLQRANSSAGCNKIRLKAKIQPGNSIRFDDFSSTKMYCASFMELETGLIKKLEQARTYAVEGHTMKLMDDAGKMLITTVAADWD